MYLPRYLAWCVCSGHRHKNVTPCKRTLFPWCSRAANGSSSHQIGRGWLTPHLAAAAAAGCCCCRLTHHLAKHAKGFPRFLPLVLFTVCAHPLPTPSLPPPNYSLLPNSETTCCLPWYREICSLGGPDAVHSLSLDLTGSHASSHSHSDPHPHPLAATLPAFPCPPLSRGKSSRSTATG